MFLPLLFLFLGGLLQSSLGRRRSIMSSNSLLNEVKQEVTFEELKVAEECIEDYFFNSVEKLNESGESVQFVSETITIKDSPPTQEEEDQEAVRKASRSTILAKKKALWQEATALPLRPRSPEVLPPPPPPLLEVLLPTQGPVYEPISSDEEEVSTATATAYFGKKIPPSPSTHSETGGEIPPSPAPPTSKKGEISSSHPPSFKDKNAVLKPSLPPSILRREEKDASCAQDIRRQLVQRGRGKTEDTWRRLLRAQQPRHNSTPSRRRRSPSPLTGTRGRQSSSSPSVSKRDYVPLHGGLCRRAAIVALQKLREGGEEKKEKNMVRDVRVLLERINMEDQSKEKSNWPASLQTK